MAPMKTKINKVKRLITAFSLALVVLLAVSLTGCGDENSGTTHKRAEIRVGELAPDFAFPAMDGETLRLSEQRGKVVFLFFWRKKCKECTDSMDSLEALHRRYKDQGLVVATVDEDNVHTASIYTITNFIEEHDYTFKVLRDSEAFLARAFQVLQAPASVIIDKQGVIAITRAGEADWMAPEVTKEIESLLKED